MHEYGQRHNINIARCMYRHNRENGRENFGNHNYEWNGIWMMVLGSMFYRNSVVGKDTYSIYTKMGGRTHSAVPLRMRTHAYTIVKT